METTTLVVISISGLLVYFTRYTLYIHLSEVLSTTKRSVRQTRGVVELMSPPEGSLLQLR